MRKNRDILSNISFSLNKGELLSVVGLNGVGKTTLLRCLIQEYKNYRGKAKYNGIDLKSINISDLSTIMGLVTTADIIRCDISVLDYLCMGMANKIAFFSSPSLEHYKKGYDICSKYNIDYLANRILSTLSQGELQIVTVLRVLLQNSDIIMDEPTAGLDPSGAKEMLELFISLNKLGKTILIVTHEMDYVLEKLTKSDVAMAYGIDEKEIDIIAYKVVNSIKITFPRQNISGSLCDSDIYGCQMHMPLANIEIV